MVGKFAQNRARYQAAKRGKRIWTLGRPNHSTRNALKHWNDHKKEFPHLRNAKEYAEEAWNFVTYPPSGTLTKVRQNGDVLFYHPGSNVFAVVDVDGIPKTMFKPKDAIAYFNKQ